MKPSHGSKVDRRREAVRAARSTVDDAGRRLSRIDDQLAADSAQTQEHETALRRAGDEVRHRKKALKAAARKAGQLAGERRRATAAAAEAQQRARTAEEKFDRAVLADLVRRERDRDLAAHPGSGTDDEAAPSSTAADTAARKTA